MVADHTICINTQSAISHGVFDKLEGFGERVLGPHFLHFQAP
jgi:hypothetical protein